MSFPRYPTYKDSGVEWLGKVPEHWKTSKLGMRCGFQSGKAHEPFITDDGQFVCVNSRFVSTQGEKVKRCSENLTPASRNDILIVMSDLPNGRALGKAFYVNIDDLYAVNQRVCRLTPLEDSPRYLYYVLDRNPGLLWFDDGVNQTHIPNSGFTKLFLSIPPLEEQISIATFLDNETTKIDALIAEQQRLIELLQEKRQAVISHAVTKGLNPDAPMKNSGVEWLGEVPVHWEIGQVRRFSKSVKTGRTPDEADFQQADGNIPWFTPGSFGSEIKPLDPDKYVCLDSVKQGRSNLFAECSVLVVGIGATLGKVAFPGKACSGNQQINAIEPLVCMNSRFLALALTASAEQMKVSSNASTIGIMNQQKTKEIFVALPPMQEQEEIADYLELACEELASLSDSCGNAIKLLQERRSALISAAVTGQIDVRNSGNGDKSP